MSVIRHVIWDFNGTLLDDLDCCVATLNTLLAERNLALLSRERYLERFGFPVKDFYLELGFDLDQEDFAELSRTYIERYGERVDMAAPHADALGALEALREREVPQSVLSAMERSLLEQLLQRFGLAGHMAHVRGLDHHGASSKVALGLELQRELDLPPRQILLVGDTLHDHETAAAIGCQCLLFARGHQTAARLTRSGATVIQSLSAVAQLIDATNEP